MSKNIVDGQLVEMSPSMIVQFDASTPFGCERRGFYKYVMGLPDPPTGNQQLGTDLHALAEERLLTGKTPSGEGEAYGLYLAGQAMIEQVASRKILKVEQPIPAFYISGVKVKGYNDVVTSDGIVDWKTSSDIRRYGKTAAGLATDTAMVIYGKAEHPTLPTVKLAHGQFQTKGRKHTDFVEVEVTQEHLDAHIEKVIVPLVERIKVVASFKDAQEAVPDFKKCFNCAFRPRCPTPGAETVMGFFSKVINKDSTSSAVPASAVLVNGSAAPDTRAEVKAIENSMRITPPDAPPSDPAKAAVPVAGFEAVPPKKERKMLIVDTDNTESVESAAFKGESQTDIAARQALEYSQKLAEETKRAKEKNDAIVEADKPAPKRGRPPGAKNKPKGESTVPTTTTQAEEADAMGAPRQFESVSVSMGVTVNVGNFNSVRFDVSVTSKEHTYEEVYAEVKARLDAEAAKYEAEVAKGQTVNAKSVVSK